MRQKKLVSCCKGIPSRSSYGNTASVGGLMQNDGPHAIIQLLYVSKRVHAVFAPPVSVRPYISLWILMNPYARLGSRVYARPG